MDSHYRKINRDMMLGWFVIVAILLVSYTIEVLKGGRPVSYLVLFLPFLLVPLLGVYVLYRKRREWRRLSRFILAGYFVMYTFVLLTGNTNLVFTYILPLLAFLILYHDPNLILISGAAALAANLVAIVHWFHTGYLTFETSNQAEIQIAVIVMCFAGSYVASKLYNEITRQNYEYVKKLSKKNEQIERMTTQSITTFANALDAKDPYTEGHSERVSAYSTRMARELGLSEEEIDNIRLVALLHDIGKIGVPDSVLKKPGRLTDEEFGLMKQHTVVGSEIIKDINSIPGVVIGARYHHERYDGRGYPDGLKGEEIPFIARIIAVADAFDAMTSNRIYRKHLTTEQVFSELEKGAGSQFDPVIAQLLIDMLKSGAMKNLSPDMAREETQAQQQA